MKTLTRIFSVVIVAIWTTAFSAQAENLALVLSFENYESIAHPQGALANHDALIAAYRAQGYEIVGGRDKNREQFQNRLRVFAERLTGADKVVMHISGQVVHAGNQTWILPVDASPASLVDVAFQGVSLDFLMQFAAQNSANSVVFIGTTNRSFREIPGVSGGVAAGSVPRGVVLISGNHNNVTRAVLDDFLSPGETVSDALRQNRQSLVSVGTIPRNLSLSENPYQADIARENALGLSRAQRRDIQSNLNTLGFGTGGVDGVFGARTRQAIRDWQADEGRRATGYLNAGQINLLDRRARENRASFEQRDRAYWAQTGARGTRRGLQDYLERYPNGLFADRARRELAALEGGSEQNEWNRAVREHTFDSYQRYLRRFPNGAHSDTAREIMRQLGGIVDDSGMHDSDAPARLVEARLNLNNGARILVEMRLASLGYTTGPRDGVLDARTREGIRFYQRDHNMQVTGFLTSGMIASLLLNAD